MFDETDDPQDWGENSWEKDEEERGFQREVLDHLIEMLKVGIRSRHYNLVDIADDALKILAIAQRSGSLDEEGADRVEAELLDLKEQAMMTEIDLALDYADSKIGAPSVDIGNLDWFWRAQEKIKQYEILLKSNYLSHVHARMQEIGAKFGRFALMTKSEFLLRFLDSLGQERQDPLISFLINEAMKLPGGVFSALDLLTYYMQNFHPFVRTIAERMTAEGERVLNEIKTNALKDKTLFKWGGSTYNVLVDYIGGESDPNKIAEALNQLADGAEALGRHLNAFWETK